MISILRSDTPEFLDTSKRNLLPKDYSEPIVLKSLLSMQHSKCCYCERRLTDLGATERWVEHIKPQSEFKNHNGEVNWNLANGWNNLLYSCATCNRKKGKTPLIDSSTGQFILVEPSNESIDPEEHITFYIDGTLITHKAQPGSHIGQRTVDKLFTGRTELYRAFKKLKAVIDATFAEIAGAIASDDFGEFYALTNSLTFLTCSKINHAGFIRSYLRSRVDLFNEKELPQLNSHFGTNFEVIEIKITKGHTCLT